jgi:hypothetical protein
MCNARGVSRWSVGLVLLVAFCCTNSFAQNFRGGINGTVNDPTGAVMSSVSVVATAVSTGVAYNTVSSNAGQFLFQDLPIGAYTVVVSGNGFRTVKVDNVPVSAGTIYTLQIKLTLAQTNSTVDVSADQIGLDTTAATLSTVLPTKAIQDVPSNGRDITQLVAQSPGYAGYNTLGGGGYASVNGTRPTSINWQIEGTDNNDIFWNLSAANLSGASGIATTLIPTEAIDQFSFVTSSGPDIGRNAGGTVNLAIKSGTNQFHGSGFYYNRNEFFAANTPFAPTGTGKSYLRNINSGFSFGGPIVKGKTFFFSSYEYQGFGIANTISATEPSAAYQAAAQSVLSFYGVPTNVVSTALLSTLWPADALTGPAASGNYFNPAIARGFSDNGIIKLDQNINPQNNLSVKGYFGYGHAESPLPSTLTPYWNYGPQRNQNYSAILNTVISPHLTNQVSFGMNIIYLFFEDKDTNFNPVALGLNTGVTGSYLAGSPKINISNFDPLGPFPPYGRREFVPQWNEALSYVKGAHQMRFGGEFRRVRYNDLTLRSARGTFNFNGSQGPWSATPAPACEALATQNQGVASPSSDPNVLALADFMAGCVSSASIAQGDQTRQVYVNSFSLFAQDAWQVSKKLNFNYGLRYEYSGPPHDGSKDLTTFDPNVPSGLAVAGSDIANIYQQYWKAFSPRLGFAYQPKEKGNLVIRGGIGLYYDTPYLIPFFDLRFTQNGGAPGVQDNPVGSKPVAFPSVNSFVIVKDQPIFPTLTQSIAGAGVVNVFSVDPNYRPSATTLYNLNIQQGLGRAAIFQLGYVGSQSRHLTDVIDVNQAAQGSAFENPTCAPQYASAGQGNQQCSRPYFSKFPNYAVINQVQSGANANYNSLQATLRIANWHGLVSQFNYTWSHNLDFETGLIPYMPQDSTNPRGEYGNSDLDTRNTFIAYLTYDIPGSSHGPRWLSHGWQLNSALNFHGGQPYTVVASTNSSGNGEFADRADVIPGVNPYAGLSHKVVDGVVQWFIPFGSPGSAFTDPPQGQYGTERRNQYYNPGFSQVDLSVFKNTKITEKFTLQLRVEMFNVFNHINLAPVGFPAVSDTNGATFSTIGAYFAEQGIGPGEPFNTQLAAKILF